MGWSTASRQYYLGNLFRFENRYCRMDAQGNWTLKKSQGAISPDDLRLLIKCLTHAIPRASHASPKWVPKPPIIVMGNYGAPIGARRGEIKGPNRSGLCKVNNHIHYFIDYPNTIGIDCPADPNWFFWRSGGHGDEQWCYSRPLNPYGQPDAYLSQVMKQINETLDGDEEASLGPCDLNQDEVPRGTDLHDDGNPDVIAPEPIPEDNQNVPVGVVVPKNAY